MKPCASNRKLIVWQTLHALDAPQARKLRAHLESCAGCRRYLAEISNLTEGLVTVELNPDIQASDGFHRNVAHKLRAAKPDSWGEILAASIQSHLLNWRVAVPVVAALAFIGVMFATWPRPPLVAAHPSAAPSVLLAAGSDNDMVPTVANYQRMADQSLEKLDALLTRQSKRVLPALPSYTASTHSLANESF